MHFDRVRRVQRCGQLQLRHWVLRLPCWVDWRRLQNGAQAHTLHVYACGRVYVQMWLRKAASPNMPEAVNELCLSIACISLLVPCLALPRAKTLGLLRCIRTCCTPPHVLIHTPSSTRSTHTCPHYSQVQKRPCTNSRREPGSKEETPRSHIDKDGRDTDWSAGGGQHARCAGGGLCLLLNVPAL